MVWQYAKTVPPEVCLSKVVSKPYSVPSSKRGHGFAAATRLRMAASAFCPLMTAALARLVRIQVAG